jgi:hypothetical protein
VSGRLIYVIELLTEGKITTCGLGILPALTNSAKPEVK